MSVFINEIFQDARNIHVDDNKMLQIKYKTKEDGFEQ